MPPYIPRARDGEQLICEGCNEWLKRAAAFKKVAELHNPTAQLQGRNGSEWFHGSAHDFDDFGHPGGFHWNTLLGHHFTAEHEIAERFAHKEYSGNDDDIYDDEPAQHIVHAKLHIRRPKTYRSEHDMDQEAYEYEHARGNHIDKHLSDPEDHDEDEDFWFDHDYSDRGDPESYRGDSKTHYSPNDMDHGYYRNQRTFHPVATGWLNSHPDKENIAARFKQRLKDQGYDGIVYGNAFEQSRTKGPKHLDHYAHPPFEMPEVGEHNTKVPQHSISAIAFEPHQIEITQHHYGNDCKSPEQVERERKRDTALPHYETGHTQPYLPDMDSLHLTHAASKTAKVHTWKGLAYGPEGGYIEKEYQVEGPLYHGGRARVSEGDLITPGRKTNPWGDEGPKSKHVFFTTNADTAASYAQQANGHLYEVEPTGEFSMDYNGDDYKSKHPLRVVRKVPKEEWPGWAKQGKTAEMSEERKAEIERIRQERKNRPRRPAGQPREDMFSRYFTPIPEEELEEQKRAREPKSERIDDRTYSIGDVSRHYDWEGFDPYEIEHLVHQPEHAQFTREDVPVKSLRHVNEHGELVHPPSYQDIAGQDEDEQERLSELEHGMDEDSSIPPIVVVRDGEHHIIADGSHRAAIHAKRGHTHIPAFVTERTIMPKTGDMGAGGPDPFEREASRMASKYPWPHVEGPNGEPDEFPGSGIKQPRHSADMPVPLYHGTSAKFEPGDLISPGHPGNFVRRMKHVYVTESAEGAQQYGWSGLGSGWDKTKGNEQERHPRVYEVRPTGPYGHRSDAKGEYWASEDPFEVVREVWHHKPKQASLTMLADWDDDDDEQPEWCEDCNEDHTEDEGHRECNACGERHEDYEEKERHESTMTNWDEVYPSLNNTVHRVLPHMRLPDHVHEVVHDESRPIHERGQALLDHVNSEHGHKLGMHWSDVFGEGRGYGADKFAGVGGGDSGDTQVVLHARKPDRDDIETDPDTLDDHQVYGYDVHDENEVPIQQRARVHVTGVSWRPGGYHQKWRRHDLKEPIKMTAKNLPSLRTIAHDATENQAIRHCPFCGGGKIIGRADGSIECEFCHSFFTVQVQPQYPNFPQTMNGMPQQIPGMPGQVETPGGAPSGFPGDEMDAEGGFPPGDGEDDAEAGAEDDAEGDSDDAPPFAKKESFRTTTGALLGEDDYARHLAIRFSPNRDEMIARIRAEREGEQ